MNNVNNLPPLGKPLYIQSYMPLSKEIRDRSVLAVETPDDLNSQKLGTNIYEETCLTCDNPLDFCPGHDGHLELPIPIYRIHFVKRLIQILNCVCFYCQKLRLPTDDPKYQWIRNLPVDIRLDYLEKQCRQYKYCGMHPKDAESDETNSSEYAEVASKDIHAPCKKMFVQFRNEDRDSTFVRAVIRLDNIDYMRHRSNANWKPITIGPQDIFDCLQNIEGETLVMLGCNENNMPVSHMWDVLNVPSLNTRPCHTFAGIGSSKKRIFNDWTKFLRNIVMARNELRNVMKLSTEKVTCCHYIFQDIESRNFTSCFRYGYLEKKIRDKHKKRLKLDLKKTNYGAVETAWRNLHKHTAAFHSHRHQKFIQKSSYGKPLVNVEGRYKFQKYGRFRGNIVARRVDNAGRGVLEGDVNIQPDQVCIPRKEAMNISVKTYVNVWNLKQVQTWLLNGPYVYPGANYIMMKNGREINLGFHENRRDINLSEILYIRRHLMNDDVVLVGRQPTLHRPSMMSFRCVIVEGFAIRLHYAVFPPLGADCDGDEVNFQVIQTLEGMAEARELCGVKNNIMKDGKIWIKFIQNTVISAYLMTKETVFLNEDDVQYITGFMGLFGLPEPMRPGLWTGHQILSLLFPPDFTMVTDKLEIRNGQFLKGELNDKALNGNDGILHHLYKDYADHGVTLKFIHQGYLLFQNYLDLFGHSAGYFDCAIDYHDEDDVKNGTANLQLTEMIRQMEKVQINISKVNKYVDSLPSCIPNASDAITENNIRDHMDKITHMSTEAVMKYHEYMNKKYGDQNGVLHMIKSGAKGSPSTINQMCGIVGQIYVMYRRFPTTSSHFANGIDSLEAYGFIRGSYSRGLSLTGVVTESPSTCESVVNKNKGTSTAGYTIRKLTTCMMGIVIDYLNRAVDTNNRIIWSKYGNDGYDSQCMTPIPVKILNMTPEEIVKIYSIENCDDIVEPEILREWQSMQYERQTQQICEKMIADLLELHQQVRMLLSRSPDTSSFTTIRAPFDFLHLFHRCSALYPPAPRVDMHPLLYIEFTKYFWDKLVSEHLVVAENLSFKLLFFDWLSPNNLMKWKFGAVNMKWIARQIVEILGRSTVQPGESVGVLATQNMGEPFAQLTLKTPHFSGKFTNVVAGTVRISNIIDMNFCNPLMTIVLKSHIQTEMEANIFGLSLVRCYLKDIIEKYPTYKFEGTGMDRVCDIHIAIHKIQTIQRLISLRSAIKIISTVSSIPLDVFQVSYMNEPGDWFIRMKLPLKLAFWKTTVQGLTNKVDENVVAENIIYNLCNSVVIHGISNVENFVSEEIVIYTSQGTEKRWSISTLGSDLRYVLRLPEVDTQRTVSNDVTEMCNIFGMHAARKSLENEFLAIMSGMVDSRHIKLVSRMMASDLVIKGMKIKQVAQNIPPLQRAAYEQGPKQMVEYCSIAEVDEGKTICGAALLNKPMSVGTCYNTDLLPATSDMFPDIHTQVTEVADHICSYVFSPKVEGQRHFLVFYHNRKKEKFVGFMDTSYNLHLLNHEGLHEDYFNGTILEGVMQEDMFIVYDCLMTCGNKSAVLRYDQRIEIARELMFRMADPESFTVPFNMGIEESYALPIALRPETSAYLFKIAHLEKKFHVKPIFDMSGLHHYAKKWKSQLPFACSGFVFTSISAPVYPFQMKKDMGWKWDDMGSTVTFTLTENKAETKNLSLLQHQFSNSYKAKNKWPFDMKMKQVEYYRPLSGSYPVLWVKHEEKMMAFARLNTSCAPGNYECRWQNGNWHIIQKTMKEPDSLLKVTQVIESMEDRVQLTEISCT